jgi:hypothetical protein
MIPENHHLIYESIDAWRKAQTSRIENIDFICPQCKNAVEINTTCEKRNTQFLSKGTLGIFAFIIAGLSVIACAIGVFYFIFLPILGDAQSKTGKKSGLFILLAIIFIAIIISMIKFGINFMGMSSSFGSDRIRFIRLGNKFRGGLFRVSYPGSSIQASLAYAKALCSPWEKTISHKPLAIFDYWKTGKKSNKEVTGVLRIIKCLGNRSLSMSRGRNCGHKMMDVPKSIIDTLRNLLYVDLWMEFVFSKDYEGAGKTGLKDAIKILANDSPDLQNAARTIKSIYAGPAVETLARLSEENAPKVANILNS